MTKFSQVPNKSILAEPANPSESLGLRLEVQYPEKGKFELSLSEKVALKLAPWLIALLGLVTTVGGAWLWFNYMPYQALTLPPSGQVQPRK